MSVVLRTTLLLIGSNIFMTFAWYAHLKNLNDRKWYIAALASWGIALFEYLLQVPANRIGYTQRLCKNFQIEIAHALARSGALFRKLLLSRYATAPHRIR